MRSHRYVNLDIDEARYLADLIGVEYDFKRTIEWCDQYLGLDEQMLRLAEPLTTAILIQFIRSLGSGVRRISSEFFLSTLSEEQNQQYNYFKLIRNKHVAHSVNEFEYNEVRAYYIEEEIEEGVQSIGEGSYRVIGLSGSEVECIRNICLALLTKVSLEKASEKEKLLRIVSKYTEEDIEKFRAYLPKRTGDIRIKKGRQQ